MTLLSAILLTTLVCSGCDDIIFGDDPDKPEVDVISTSPKVSEDQELVKLNDVEINENINGSKMDVPGESTVIKSE